MPDVVWSLAQRSVIVSQFWLPIPCDKQAPRRRLSKKRYTVPEVRAFQTLLHCKTSLQFAAVRMAANGLNVFPTLYGEKGGTPWRFMQYTRLNIEDLPEIFKEPCNIAVMTGASSGTECVTAAANAASVTLVIEQ